MTLRDFLGDWLYWPIAAMVVGFAATTFLSNISLCYTEIRDQIKELHRAFRK
jgi:hypothetical protein